MVLLPQQRWREDAARWRRAEDMGLDTAWTYDHLAWRSLADEPWLATVPLLAAAAAVTTRIRLGTWVASPNFRHPVPFAKDVLGLDDVSGGRLTLGLGAGGGGWDASVLGGEPLAPRQRVDRFAEFTALLDRLLTSAETSWTGEWYSAVRARMLPGPVQSPRPPFVVAANGPRSMRTVAAFGQGWATTGPEDVDEDAWWTAVGDLGRRLDDVLAGAGRDPSSVERYLNVDRLEEGGYSLSSLERFTDVVGRAAEAGFTEVATHWPRPSGAYAGREDVLDDLAAALPALRAL
jgi:alkanesulfonate monooxygenase SsuD/methylene tetrahydromethanopterin reductase-like flavin-dependent oxidoreductase (luciferase family)